jgi:hypothetical protein
VGEYPNRWDSAGAGVCPVDQKEGSRRQVRRRAANALLDRPADSGPIFTKLYQDMGRLYPATPKGICERDLDVFDVGWAALSTLIYLDLNHQFMKDVKQGRPLVKRNLPLNYLIAGRSQPYPEGSPYDLFMREMVDRMERSSRTVFRALEDPKHPYFPLLKQQNVSYDTSHISYAAFRATGEPADLWPPPAPTATGYKAAFIANTDTVIQLLIARQLAKGARPRTGHEWLQALLRDRERLARGDNLTRKVLNSLFPSAMFTDMAGGPMSQTPHANLDGTFEEREGNVRWRRRNTRGEWQDMKRLNEGELTNTGRCSSAIWVHSSRYIPLEQRQSVPELFSYADAVAGRNGTHSINDAFLISHILMTIAPFIAKEAGMLDYQHK